MRWKRELKCLLVVNIARVIDWWIISPAMFSKSSNDWTKSEKGCNTMEKAARGGFPFPGRGKHCQATPLSTIFAEIPCLELSRGRQIRTWSSRTPTEGAPEILFFHSEYLPVWHLSGRNRTWTILGLGVASVPMKIHGVNTTPFGIYERPHRVLM